MPIKSQTQTNATDFDKITAEATKTGWECIVNMHHKIFNKILSEEGTPIDWSKTIVPPIHKNGNKLDPTKYRAISLLPTPGKVFNHVFLLRIYL